MSMLLPLPLPLPLLLLLLLCGCCCCCCCCCCCVHDAAVVRRSTIINGAIIIQGWDLDSVVPNEGAAGCRQAIAIAAAVAAVWLLLLLRVALGG